MMMQQKSEMAALEVQQNSSVVPGERVKSLTCCILYGDDENPYICGIYKRETIISEI